MVELYICDNLNQIYQFFFSFLTKEKKIQLSWKVVWKAIHSFLSYIYGRPSSVVPRGLGCQTKSSEFESRKFHSYVILLYYEIIKSLRLLHYVIIVPLYRKNVYDGHIIPVYYCCCFLYTHLQYNSLNHTFFSLTLPLFSPQNAPHQFTSQDVKDFAKELFIHALLFSIQNRSTPVTVPTTGDYI